MSFDSTRNVNGDTAGGAAEGSQTFFALRADYMFGQGALRFGLTAAFEAYNLSVDAWEETGLPLANWRSATRKMTSPSPAWVCAAHMI